MLKFIEHFLMLLCLLIFWGEGYLCYRIIKERQKKNKAVLSIGICVILFVTFQYVKNVGDIRPLSSAGSMCLKLMMFIILLVFIVQVIGENKWNKEHISDFSIEEGLDSLPVGIAVYSSLNGMPILVNAIADKVSMRLFGNTLINGLKFNQEYHEYIKGCKEELLHMDDHLYMLTENKLRIDDTEYIELLFYDIKDVHEINEKIHKDNEIIKKLNERLRALNRRINDLSVETELINIKSKVHDDLGEALTITRNYLKQNEPEINKNKLFTLWLDRLDFMKSVSENKKKDEYQNLFSAAKDVGVDIVINGELPDKQPAKQICSMAMHECLTNTIRHAKGDKVYVETHFENDDKFIIKITNNGYPPLGKIKESGGLANLRSIVEMAGASMDISTDEVFLLTICIYY